jgi:hypothetical protein
MLRIAKSPFSLSRYSWRCQITALCFHYRIRCRPFPVGTVDVAGRSVSKRRHLHPCRSGTMSRCNFCRLSPPSSSVHGTVGWDLAEELSEVH